MFDGILGTPSRRARPAVLARVTNFHVYFLVSLVFLVPNAILATSLRPFPAAIVLAGCVCAGVIVWRERLHSEFLRTSPNMAALAVCLGVGMILCLLGGEAHVFLPKPDWLIRDAVLSDLVRNGLTVLYRHDGQDYLLRAPLGMYLLPAAIGRVMGLYTAHLALLAQNSLIVGSVVYLAVSVANVRRAPMALLLLGFSGLDMVGVLAAMATELAASGAFMTPNTHLEWWSLYFWPGPLQYSSHVTQIFWVPNHMAPGWWFAALLLLHARGAVSFSALLASCGPMLLWSPLAMAGAAPFVLLFAARQTFRGLLTRQPVAAAVAPLCFLPIAVYLTLDAGAVSHEWLILRSGFLRQYVFFLLVEIPQAAVVLYCLRLVEAEDRPALWLALAILLVLPVYSFGPGNDLMMRASIPALFILGFHFARIAVLTPRDGGARASAVSTLVLLSMATPLVEIRGAVGKSYAISDCSLVTSSRKVSPNDLPTNYWARIEKVPVWLLDVAGAPPALTREDRKCWPDHPLLEEGRR